MKKTEVEKNRELRARVKELEKELHEMKWDRILLRDHFQQRFNWWFKLIAENQTPSLSYLAKDDAMWLRRFKWWHF